MIQINSEDDDDVDNVQAQAPLRGRPARGAAALAAAPPPAYAAEAAQPGFFAQGRQLALAAPASNDTNFDVSLCALSIHQGLCAQEDDEGDDGDDNMMLG